MGRWLGVELDGLVLHSGRLTLRPWQAGDGARVAELLAEERMHTHLSLPRPYTVAEAMQFVGSTAPDGIRAGSALPLAIADNSSGLVLGSVGLRNLATDSTSVEVGYWIGPDSWGHGLATQACSTVSRFALAAGASRVQLRCAIANVGSAKVALKSGFRFEGILRSAIRRNERGVCDDLALFARTADDDGAPVAPALPPISSVTDGVVLLRPMVGTDWPTVLAENRDSESARWSFGDPPLTEPAARALAEAAPLGWLTGGQARMVVIDAATSESAGVFTLRNAGPPGVLGIGYGVLPPWRGRGFTTRALGLIAGWAREQAGLGRLELGCKAANLASARAAERAGFTREAQLPGRLRNADGTFADEIQFSLIVTP
jgi:RimJ/RimL family protein N-acetyltransferase